MSAEPEQGTPPAPTAGSAPAPQAVEATLQDFQRVQLRVGTVLTAEAHPNADRLLVVQVDLGEGSPRQIVAGIRAAYAPESLIGKQVVVVANLKPALLRGIESRGMLLAASDAAGNLAVVGPERPFAPGSTVK